MKWLYSSVFVVLVVSASFVSISRSYSNVTLSRRYMGELEGGQGAGWGEGCTCYYWTTCNQCVTYSSLNTTNYPYLSTYCDTALPIANPSWSGDLWETAECDSFSVDCGNHWDCTGDKENSDEC